MMIVFFSQVLHDANQILKVLQVSNSCVNIFIYGQMHCHFRSTLRKLFRGESLGINPWSMRDNNLIRQNALLLSPRPHDTLRTPSRNNIMKDSTNMFLLEVTHRAKSPLLSPATNIQRITAM